MVHSAGKLYKDGCDPVYREHDKYITLYIVMPRNTRLSGIITFQRLCSCTYCIVCMALYKFAFNFNFIKTPQVFAALWFVPIVCIIMLGAYAAYSSPGCSLKNHPKYFLQYCCCCRLDFNNFYTKQLESLSAEKTQKDLDPMST